LMLDLTIGYGYCMHRVLYWILLITAIGAVAFRTGSEARENRMPFGIASASTCFCRSLDCSEVGKV
jgi:hypothetical protein